MSVKNKASIEAVMGASGSGKSTYIKQALKKRKPARLIIIDPQDEYGDHATLVASMRDLWAAVMDDSKPRARFALRIRLKGDKEAKQKAFSAICRLVLAVRNVTLVVEELHLVTTPSYAPPGWSEANLTGRHKGLKIIGASQRPASVDKDFFGNATLVRCGRLNYASDISTMANVLAVDKTDLTGLAELEYIERDMRSGTTRRGKVKF
jgi:hypothetical protein